MAWHRCSWCALLVLSFVLSSPSHGQTFFSSRLGMGPSTLISSDAVAHTQVQQLTLRLGNSWVEWPVSAGIDLTSYRLGPARKLLLERPTNGNDAQAFFAGSFGPSSVWLALGKGEIRLPTPDSSEALGPQQLKTNTQELGLSYDFYRSESARLEACILFRRTFPEKAWQQTHNLRKIESWQLDLGIKLLDF